jgi:hypothetical protein
MRELNPQPTEDRVHRRLALFRFVLGNAQIFAAGLGLAFLIYMGPRSWWTIATVCVGLALAGVSVVTRRMAARGIL